MPEPLSVFEVRDGEDEDDNWVSLVDPENGFLLTEWEPLYGEAKGGGVWADSPLAHGRKLVLPNRRQNAGERYITTLADDSQDLAIDRLRKLELLLEKAAAYNPDGPQNTPVYVKLKSPCETNTRYAIVENWAATGLPNPYAEPFFSATGEAVVPKLVLELEREPFLRHVAPGLSECVQLSTRKAWAYNQALVLNSGLPVGQAICIIELASGRLVCSERTGSEVWRTDDGGATPWNASAVPPTIDLSAMVETAANTIIGPGDNAGAPRISWSQNGAQNWADRNNAHSTTGHGLVYRASDAYLYMADTYNEHICRSNDDALNWTNVHDLDGIQLVFLTSEDTLFAATSNGLVVRSTNGTAWEQVGFIYDFAPTGFFEFQGYLWIYGSSISDARAQIWVSFDDGETWDLTWEDPNTLITYAIRDIVPLQDGTLQMLSSTHVFISDDGYRWRLVSDGVLAASVFSAFCERTATGITYFPSTGNIYQFDATTTTVGRAATCLAENLVKNAENESQLTDVWVYDAAPATWTAQFPAAAFPYDLLPDPFTTNDAVFFGIDTSIVDSGPFCCLVFDIDDPLVVTGANTIRWEYWTGAAWAALDVRDNTALNYPFERTGVHSVWWTPPSDWATTAVNGVTGYWVRVFVQNLGGAHVQTPTQQVRDVYTVNWAKVDIAAAQVAGTAEALLQLKLKNVADKDGPGGDAPEAWVSRVLVGARSMDRGGGVGSNFFAFLECSDEQNPIGVFVIDGANTSFAADIETPTGRRMTYLGPADSAWSDECTIDLSSTIARDYYGRYHAFVRAEQTDGDSGDVRVRLQVRSGTGGITFTTGHEVFPNSNPWQLIDLGEINVPVSGNVRDDELPDELQFVIQVWSSAARTVYLYDLVIIPVDEWAGDFYDRAFEQDSPVVSADVLDIDSVTYPRRRVRAMVRRAGSPSVIKSDYRPQTPSEAVLQANAAQRLWFLSARGCVTGTHTGANNQAMLTDSAASFLTSGVREGMLIQNLTDGSEALVSAVTATTITGTLAGGTENDWDTNDEYVIYCPSWRSEPWYGFSVQVFDVERYLSLRGDG